MKKKKKKIKDLWCKKVDECCLGVETSQAATRNNSGLLSRLMP